MRGEEGQREKWGMGFFLTYLSLGRKDERINRTVEHGKLAKGERVGDVQDGGQRLELRVNVLSLII